MTKKFSIIIAVYNTEKYTERAVESILSQGYKEYEIIFINDGSPDNSEAVIKEIIKKNPNVQIKYIYQNNKGLAGARNTGLMHSEGEYIIWLDCDDVLQEGALEKLATLTTEKPDVIVNRISSYFESTQEIKECNYFFSSEKIIDRKEMIHELNRISDFWFAAWCFVVNREFLKKSGLTFCEEVDHEDELWSPELICLAGTFCGNNKSVYLNTYFRKGSIVSTKNVRRDISKLKICEKLRDFTTGLSDKASINFVNRRIIRIMYSVYSRIHTYDKNGDQQKLADGFDKTLKNIYGKRRFMYKVILYARSVKK